MLSNFYKPFRLIRVQRVGLCFSLERDTFTFRLIPELKTQGLLRERFVAFNS